MSWFSKLIGNETRRDVLLSSEQRQVIADWQSLPSPDLNLPHQNSRYVVADVESSGLDMATDRLLSIGAVAVVNGVIDVSDAFEVVLRQDEEADILVDRIGGSVQREGMDPPEALIEFLRFVGKSPLVAYHALFEQAMIARAMNERLGLAFDPAWIDLAWVMPDLFREGNTDPVDLDDWLGLFGIQHISRHNAVSDAYATAQLLQVAIARGTQRHALSPASFLQIEKSRRWMFRAG
jgi:DNA polymerase-3 subunit epsilon